MLRRAFLKNSVAGVGSVAGLYGRGLRSQAQTPNPMHAGMDSIVRSDMLAWGMNTAVLKSPWGKTPTWDELLADRDHTLVLDKFFRVGGESRPFAQTECRVAFDDTNLLVFFRCAESDMQFPYANLDENLWAKANWDSLRGLPSGATSAWPPYPDEVDILIQPDRNKHVFFQFAAILQGRSFGCKRILNPESLAAPEEIAIGRESVEQVRIEGFECSIVPHKNEWTAAFRIPWVVLDGKPKISFGMLPMRTRWRNGEFSAPVALDFNEAMPVDLLIETHFTQPGSALEVNGSLCRLPSGRLRWQVPTERTYPGPELRNRIWELQSSLMLPSDSENLAQRLYLTQRWMDLLTLEGFTPLKTGWGLLTDDLTLTFLRQRVNAAFQLQDSKRALGLLDDYLRRLDQISRWWFADGSPGNMLKAEWNAISTVDALTVEDNILVMPCVAGGRRIQLRLALPETGGVRIFGEEEGFWRPSGFLPLNAQTTGDSCFIRADDGQIEVQRDPFSITLSNNGGKEILRLKGRDIAFRFGPERTVAATDLRLSLDAAEVIYGFGEQYDRFNRSGSIVTLWETDDTVGNGKGLANATYKPLPIFQSSKPYMAFSNSSYRLRGDIGSTVPGQCRLTQHGPIFDYYFWPSVPEMALKSYTGLTGRPPLPPKWVFEPWMGRGGGAWADGKIKDSMAWSIGELGDAIDEEQTVVKRFEELDIPHSAIYAEGPTALSRDLNEFMASHGIKTLGYFRPEIGPARQRQLMRNVKPEELPILRCGTERQTDALSYVDFTNPNSTELCRRALKQFFERGVAGSMVDFGDWTPENAMFHNGQLGTQMHNFYCYDYHRIVSEVFQEHRGNDFILYARGAAPGTQKWLGQFAGDHPSTFEGLRHVLTGALNLCACGYSTWGSDIGGYFGFPQPAVYMRWVQFGCFSPLMRPHGIAPREPWHFGEAAISNYKVLAWTRENLLNYIHNAAALAHQTGLPIMRSMAAAFPAQPQLAAVSDQYMFGPDLLVAPVVEEGVVRTVAFPPGRWTSIWDGDTIAGPIVRNIEAPLDTIPVYMRPGATFPVQLGAGLHFGESMTADRTHAVIVCLPSSSEVISFANSNGDAATVSSQPSKDSCRWTLRRLPEIGALILYGSRPAHAVKLNGELLPRSKRNANRELGDWEQDMPGNRVVVRLPTRHAASSEPVLTIDVAFTPA